MAEITDMAPIFVKQYQICLYIEEVLIIRDSKVFNSLPTYIKDTYHILLRNSNFF